MDKFFYIGRYHYARNSLIQKRFDFFVIIRGISRVYIAEYLLAWSPK